MLNTYIFMKNDVSAVNGCAHFSKRDNKRNERPRPQIKSHPVFLTLSKNQCVLIFLSFQLHTKGTPNHPKDGGVKHHNQKEEKEGSTTKKERRTSPFPLSHPPPFLLLLSGGAFSLSLRSPPPSGGAVSVRLLRVVLPSSAFFGWRGRSLFRNEMKGH